MKAWRELNKCLVLPTMMVLFYSLSASGLAQSRVQLPAPTSRVTDATGALDDVTKQRLETILENLGQRSKIEFYVAVVESTGGQDIFEFSRQLAHDWNIGARTTAKKSLLLVLSINERSAFVQFSRSVQGQLPDGVLGEMTQRMRTAITAGRFSEAVNTGIDHFVSSLGRTAGFTTRDLEQPTAIAAAVQPEPTPNSQLVSATAMPSPDTTTASAPEPEKRVARNKRDALRSVKSRARTVNSPEDEANEAEEVELTLTLPFEARVEKLKQFLDSHPNSNVRAHAQELLVSAYAALGDQKLKNGDASGAELLLLAIEQAPANSSEKLFSGVISQIPLNLYLRGERVSAFKAAQRIEAKFGDDPKHLLAMAGFYLRMEQGQDASRVAAQAVKLAPESAEAHHLLAVGLQISLRLDNAIAEYLKALELDPRSKGTRRNLADLKRATGKPDEALALYREQLNLDPTDKAARAGLVLALLESGKKDEGNTELDAVLKDDPQNLNLLTSAAYWFVAHGDSDRGFELARKAVEIEPRYTWAQIAAARALISRKQLLDAERAVRFAKLYGKFPTLDYELASVLSAAGLYEEAAEALQQSFTIKDGEVETRLAGQHLAQAAGFQELLAPERRASIFQFDAADTANNSNSLKTLLVFAMSLADTEKVDEATAVAAAKQFAAGTDSMRAYRQLYVASRLLRRGIGLPTVYDLAQEAKNGVDAALDAPVATLAVQADEFRDLRARALASNATPYIPEAPRSVLGNILRGRIEDLSGWAFFNQDKPEDAVPHLKLAASTLPEATPSWRAALWHLGAALEQVNQNEEALNYYIKSYVSGDPDPVRKQLIEQLYRKVNGSLEGLDQRMTAQTAAVSSSAATATNVPDSSKEKERSESTSSTESTSSQPAPAAAIPSPSPDTVATAPTEKPSSNSTPAREDSSATSKSEAAPSPEAAPPPRSQPAPTEEEVVAQAAARLRSTVKITGRVKDASDKGIPNVVVVLISPRGSVIASTTDADGNYVFNVPPSQRNYRLVPSKDGYQFEPLDKALVAFSEDLKGVDFVGTTRAP